MFQRYKHVLGYTLMGTSILMVILGTIFYRELFDFWIETQTIDLKNDVAAHFTSTNNLLSTLLGWSLAMIPGGLFLGRHLVRTSERPWIF